MSLSGGAACTGRCDSFFLMKRGLGSQRRLLPEELVRGHLCGTALRREYVSPCCLHLTNIFSQHVTAPSRGVSFLCQRVTSLSGGRAHRNGQASGAREAAASSVLCLAWPRERTQAPAQNPHAAGSHLWLPPPKVQPRRRVLSLPGQAACPRASLRSPSPASLFPAGKNAPWHQPSESLAAPLPLSHLLSSAMWQRESWSPIPGIAYLGAHTGVHFSAHVAWPCDSDGREEEAGRTWVTPRWTLFSPGTRPAHSAATLSPGPCLSRRVVGPRCPEAEVLSVHGLLTASCEDADRQP